MKVLVTGASGLIGSALCATLAEKGHDVGRLQRREGAPGKPWWDLLAGEVHLGAFSGPDAVVHLAGDNIASGRWTATKKKRIRESRVLGTELLVDHLAKLEKKPRVLLSASAIGYYGDCGGGKSRDPRGSPAYGGGAEWLGRCPAEDAHAVQAGRGWHPRRWFAVYELDQHPGRGRESPLAAGTGVHSRTRESRLTDSGDQPAVHQGLGEGAESADHFSDARPDRAASLRPDGRGITTGQRPRDTTGTGGRGLHVSAYGVGRGAPSRTPTTLGSLARGPAFCSFFGSWRFG